MLTLPHSRINETGAGEKICGNTVCVCLGTLRRGPARSARCQNPVVTWWSLFARITVAQDRGGFGCSPRTVREGKDGGILFSLLGDLIDLLVGEGCIVLPQAVWSLALFGQPRYCGDLSSGTLHTLV